MKLTFIEARRSLRRQVVWVLIGIALVGIAVMAIVAFVDSSNLDVTRLRAEGNEHPAVLVDWWVPGSGDGVLMVGALFLTMGAVIGGASVVGGEWRAGNVATVLLWEPRRLRVFAARVVAAVGCAAVIAAALQVVLLLSLSPAVLLHGTTAGADASWWLGLTAAIARLSLATGFAAGVAACIAFACRTTAGAIVALWAWLALVESLLRIHIGGASRYLIGENLTRVLTWTDLREQPTMNGRSPMGAAALLLVYGAAIAAAAAWSFSRRDVVVD